MQAVSRADAISNAERFFEQNGRDIDRARFAYHFRGGSQDELLATLGAYQNADGGFGNGLEPDISAPLSNPFATELALLVCLQADVRRDHPLLTRIVAYLEQTLEEGGAWRLAREALDYPHAPWWEGAPDQESLNPACTLAGLLRELGLGSERLHTRVTARFDLLAKPEDLLGDDFYAARPYAYYFMSRCEHPQRELYGSGVLWWLLRQHVEAKGADAGHFFEFVRGPETETGRLLPTAILSDELDKLTTEQQEDGGWSTPYDEHWRGWTTVQSLLVLRAFNRV